MISFGTWQQQPISFTFRRQGLTVSTGPTAAAFVLTYDSAGRLWSMFEGGVTYRRALDGRVLARERSEGQRRRWWLPPAEGDTITQRAATHLRSLCTADLRIPLTGAQEAVVRQAACFDAARSRVDRAHFHAVYKPVGILPPDQYLSIVLQATEGCAFNTCTFCTFYKDRPFRVKTLDAFSEHVEGVRRFLGEGVRLRRGIFLGDANALILPVERLLPMMALARRIFGAQLAIHAFLDGFSGQQKTPDEYAALREVGLRRIYIGLESGSKAVLNRLNKPGTPRDALKAVRAIKAGGASVGVIVLLGAGGQPLAGEHVRETIAVVNAMGLNRDDLLYLSDLFYGAHTPALPHSELRAQEAQIRAGLQFPAEAPRISRYDIREFVY